MSVSQGRVTSRVRDLSDVGETLLKYIGPDEIYIFDNIFRTSSGVCSELVERESNYVNLLFHKIKIKGINSSDSDNIYMKAVAVCVLLCNIPFQVDVPEHIILRLCEESLPKIGRNTLEDSIDLVNEEELKNFPIKTNEAAPHKTNVFFSEVIKELKKKRPTDYFELLTISREMMGLTNDQATAMVLFGKAIWKITPNNYELALRLIKNPHIAKALTTVIKSTGMNSTKVGACLCETNCLTGRGVGDINLEEELRARCGLSGITKTPKLFEDNELRDAVRKIISEELDIKKVQIEDKDKFWSRRWIWFKNGGHSRTREKHEPEWRVKTLGRIHRRVFAENIVINPLDEWNGVVYVSASKKLEPGKTRLIIATDTVSYVCFDHFSRAVEGAWRNKRVLLNPGKSGTLDLVNEVRNLRGAVNIMLDYDDFNAQHTKRAMQIVIEELGKAIKYDSIMLAKLVKSLDRTRGFAGGVDCGYISGGLCSGHRCTTLINSILNAAYIIAANPGLWNKIDSRHTGDDVVARATSVKDAADLVIKLRGRGCKLNEMKQSIGYNMQEFLRMAIGRNFAIGYVARAIIECVNGNWVNENPLTPSQSLRTLVTMSRAIINRCQDDSAIELIVPSVRRVLGPKNKLNIKALLKGEMGIEGGPIFAYNTLAWRGYSIGETNIENRKKFKNQISRATDSYLTNHATPVEREVMISAGLSVRDTMLESSYGKSIAREYNIKPSYPTVRELAYEVDRRTISVEKLSMESKREGLLSHYPLLNILRERIDSRMLRRIFDSLGVVKPIGQTYREAAWGTGSRGIIIQGTLPYGFAASLCGRGYNGVVFVTYHIYM